MDEIDQNLLEEVKKSVKTTCAWYTFAGVLQSISALAFTVAIISMLSSGFDFSYIMLPLLFYVFIDMMVILMAVSLFRASSAGNAAILANDNQSLANFMSNTAKYWTYNGIMIIVTFVLLMVLTLQGEDALGSLGQLQ